MNPRSDVRSISPGRALHGKRPCCSARSLLIMLVLGCLLPGFTGVILLLVHHYQEDQARLEHDTLQMARALVQAVDNQLFQVRALAHGLATATSLAHGDLAGFHAQARQTLQRADLGPSVVLIDGDGQQVVNTTREFGEPLPATGNPDLVRRVFASGAPVVSDLYFGSVLQRAMTTVAVPVFIDGRVAYALVVPILADKFNALLLAQGLPLSWVATVLDGKGTIVARTRAAEELLGKKAVPAFLERYLAAREGTVTAVARDGVPVFSVFIRSPATGWGVAIGIPLASFDTAIRHNLFILMGGIGGLFAIGLGLACFLGRKIARSFRALTAPAEALEAGRSPALPAVAVSEAAEVGRTLVHAARLLQERQAALAASEEKYRTLFLNMTEGFALGEPIFDKGGKAVDYRLLEVNEAFYTQTGLPRNIVGRPVREFLSIIEQSWVDAYAEVALAGRARRIDDYNEGTRRHYQVHAFSPAPGLFASLFRDVTEEKRVERQLKESESHLRQLIATIPGMVWTATPGGGVDFLSRQWLDYTGTSLESQLGEGYLGSIHPDDRDGICRLGEECQARKSSFHTEFRLRRHDGAWRWFRARGTPLLDGDGEVSRWLGITIDIDDLKRTQEALFASNARFQAVFEQAAVGIARVALDGRLLEVNDGFCAILGYGRDELQGRTFPDITYPPDVAESLARFQDFLSRRERYCSLEKRYVRRDGTPVWANLIASLVCTPDGRPDYAIAVIEDIQGRKEAEGALEAARYALVHRLEQQVRERTAALQEAHDHLEERVAARTEQVRHLAAALTFTEERERQALARDLHDNLGQILHVVKLKLSVLARKNLPAPEQALVREASSLLSDASRQARSLTSQLSPPVLSTLGLPAALQWLAGEIQATYGLTVHCRAHSAPGGLTPAQSTILFRAARELLINAARHSGSASACLELARDQETLILTVADGGNGAPVPEEDLSQGDGLGLASIRERISFLDGEVTIEAPASGGVTVRLRVPVEDGVEGAIDKRG